MTEAEREMMNTIHLYGLIFSLGDGSKFAFLEHIKATLEEQDGD